MIGYNFLCIVPVFTFLDINPQLSLSTYHYQLIILPPILIIWYNHYQPLIILLCQLILVYNVLLVNPCISFLAHHSLHINSFLWLFAYYFVLLISYVSFIDDHSLLVIPCFRLTAYHFGLIPTHSWLIILWQQRMIGKASSGWYDHKAIIDNVK